MPPRKPNILFQRTRSLKITPPWLVFGAALVIRISFFALVGQPPVQFDARRYVSVALAAPLAIPLAGESERLNDVDFNLIYHDLLHGEGVSWFPYVPPTFPQAADDLFFTGPVYPAVLGAVFRLTPIHDFWVARILQAILDSFTAFLICLLGARLISRQRGWIAGGLWAIYGPAIYKTGELITETTAIFLGVLCLWFLMRGYDQRQYRHLAAAGVTLAALSCTKAAASALIVPLLLGWLWANRRELAWALGSAAIVGITAAAALIPWLAAVHWRYDVFALRDPSYGGANLRNANILITEGYNLDSAPPDFWTYPIWREMRRHPGRYAGHFVRKFYRMWSRPSDDYRLGFPFGGTGTLWFHRLLVLLAMVGLLNWPTRAGPCAWLPVAFVGYFVGLHLLMHAISRYNLLAMPVVCAAATVGILQFAEERGRLRILRLGPLIAGLAAVAVGLWFLRPDTWMILGLISVAVASYLFWITGVILIGVTVCCVARALSGGRSASKRVAWVSGGILIVCFLAQRVPPEGHAEWSVLLNDPDLHVRRVITFPESFDPDRAERIYLNLDVRAETGKTMDVRFQVDHIGVLTPVDSLVDSATFYAKPSYRPFLDAYGMRRCDIRSWARYVLTPEVLKTMLSDQEISVTLTAIPRGLNPGGLYLYGSRMGAGGGRLAGPGLTYAAVERLYEGKDPRIWEVMPLQSAHSRSEFFHGKQSRTSDLSESWGRQSGEYRIIVSVLMPGGKWLYF